MSREDQQVDGCCFAVLFVLALVIIGLLYQVAGML